MGLSLPIDVSSSLLSFGVYTGGATIEAFINQAIIYTILFSA